MDERRRRRARLLIEGVQPFADETLHAVANFTWLGNSMGSQPGVRGRADLAPGLPDWTLIGAGATTLFIVATAPMRFDTGTALIGRWPLTDVHLTEERYPRKVGPIRLGAWRAIRFGFPDRPEAVLQPFGWEVDELLAAHRAAQTLDLTGVRWEAVTEVSLRTTGRGPFEEDVFFVFAYDDGASTAIGLGDSDEVLPRVQRLPGFDNEAFIKAMGASADGVVVLWRRP